jgi:hypothetical protein
MEDNRYCVAAVVLAPQWRIDERFIAIVGHLDLNALAAYGSAALADND